MVKQLGLEKVVEDTRWEQNGQDVSIVQKFPTVLEGQFRSPDELDQFCRSALHTTVETGTHVVRNDVQCLRFSPFAIYLICEQNPLEDMYARHPDKLTDMSHGKCLLEFQGAQVLEFLSNYCSANLMSDDTQQRAMVKTRMIDYEVLLWRSSDSQVELLVDRSYVKSFIDFTHSLFIRYTAN